VPTRMRRRRPPPVSLTRFLAASSCTTANRCRLASLSALA
jgi:hypothetical protein